MNTMNVYDYLKTTGLTLLTITDGKKSVTVDLEKELKTKPVVGEHWDSCGHKMFFLVTPTGLLKLCCALTSFTIWVTCFEAAGRTMGLTEYYDECLNG
jgi:hypothetical protein